MRLKGKIALVTGGSRGIGRAIAEGFAREGAAVAINYVRHEEAARQTVQAIESRGGRALAVQADVRSVTSVQAMVHQVVEAFGRLDILVNNAGVLSRAPFLELSVAEFQRIIETNVNGAFHVAQAAARVMAAQGEGGGGVILNISSICARRAYPNLAHYNASKAAVSMLTRCLALELAPHGIRVNEICPGLVETDLNRKDLQDPRFRRARVEAIPLGRVGRPQDLVEAAVYLCSDDASWVTGSSLAIDGGAGVIP